MSADPNASVEFSNTPAGSIEVHHVTEHWRTLLGSVQHAYGGYFTGLCIVHSRPWGHRLSSAQRGSARDQSTAMLDLIEHLGATGVVDAAATEAQWHLWSVAWSGSWGT